MARSEKLPTRRTSHTASESTPAGENIQADVLVDGTEEGEGEQARHGALLRRAWDVLDAKTEPMSAADLAQAVFGLGASQTGTPLPWTSLLEQLLRPSSLFLKDASGAWRLASWDVAEQRLADIEFVAVDVETTGLAPGRHKLIEVGAVRIRGGEPVATFSKLINPGRHIPQFITQFTGISEYMVSRAARASKVLPKLQEFIGDRPIVGHNIGFDLGFLNYEAEQCGMATPFPVEGIDTIALARRYITGMRRAKLDYVAAALHVPTPRRHRALPDAVVTARVFALLLARAREEGCETLDELRDVLHGVAPSRTSVPLPRPTGRIYLNPAWRQDFPKKPGVYLMKDEHGTVIYVGKAKCLRDRLSSYYSQPLGYTRKMDGLLQSVRAIETRVLGSELEALLVESSLIKALQPRYNVQLRNYELYPFIKVDLKSAYPRFHATRDVSPDGARYFGPFRSQRIVTTTLELLQKVFPLRTCTRALPPTGKPSDPCLRYHVRRCPGPCRGELDDDGRALYREAVEEACKFLGGERADLIDRLKRQMFEAAARQDFERAARLRDALRDADQVLLGQRLVTGAVEANNLLIVYPSSEDGAVEVYLIRHGRLARQVRVAREVEAIFTSVCDIASAAREMGTAPARVGREEVDQINIIARWISHHSEDDERSFFRLPRDLGDSAEVEAFARRVAVAALVQRDSDVSDESEDDNPADDDEALLTQETDE